MADTNDQFFDSNGTRIRFRDRGEGEPVLCIHGFTLDLETGWVETGVWTTLVEAGYRVIAYDTRGHGLSDKPHEVSAYGPVELTDAIGMLDHLGIEQAHVVGWSRGGFLAGRLRAAHQDRVKTLTVAGFGESGVSDGAMSEPARIQTTAVLEAADYTTLVRGVIPDGAPEEVQMWATLLEARNDHLALAACIQAAWPILTPEELRANRSPALGIIGDADLMHDEMRKMSAVMSGLDVAVITDADHGSTLVRPEFTEVLLKFLGEHADSA